MMNQQWGQQDNSFDCNAKDGDNEMGDEEGEGGDEEDENKDEDEDEEGSERPGISTWIYLARTLSMKLHLRWVCPYLLNPLTWLTTF